ncbi:circularly permuted type 2 ATP-grasp protein [Thalassovita taeanensis]|nr:circularly permuted type 2 ATP-grasp protein [Thalassovita taeanensis]
MPTGLGSDLVKGYAVPSGAADELFDKSGQMRPVWTNFINHISSLSADQLGVRIAHGDQYLRDAGVYFRRYSGTSPDERDWPLSHIPVLLHDDDWQQITRGLIQRADLLEHVLTDIYGAQTLASTGQIPAELLAQNPEWLRPMVGIVPRSGYFLHHLAFEIGRNPDGSWFVLGDRTQAPSGAGFALENRRATSRVFSDYFTRTNVRRLAGFFRDFRDTLRAHAGSSSDAAILTPGPGTDTYFEHVYIARYLGLMLLEGEDLTVQNGQAMVRTVSGLRPINMLWRRLDAPFADPLELDEHSHIGTPGLVGALRAGNLSMINALGSGVMETRALMAFLPRIAKSVLNTPLILPNIATWWCGHAAERAYVKAQAGRLAFGSALSTGLPYDRDSGTSAANAAPPPGQDLAAWIDAQAGNLVAQQSVRLSTTPVYENGRLVPRPMTIRVFLARTDNGWQVMPGGYARIGKNRETTALGMQGGGSVADVWVVSDTPVPRETLSPAKGSYQRVPEGALPSRAADNLFWLGRYVERAEGTIRLLRAYHLRLAETDDPEDPSVAYLASYLLGWGVDPTQPIPEALTTEIGAATNCASKVRDRFSVDGWTALNDLTKSLGKLAVTVEPGDDCARAMGVLLRKLSGFSGLVQDNMYRSSGWHFLEFGRALERVSEMASALASFTDPDAPEGCLDVAIELGDSVITHQRRYLVDPNRQSVIDLLALDRCNPRAILFQIDTLHDLIPALPFGRPASQHAPLSEQIEQLQTKLGSITPDALSQAQLTDIGNAMAELSASLTTAYLN